MSFQFKQFSAVFFAATSLSSPIFAQDLAEEVAREYFGELEQSGMKVALGDMVISGKSVEWKNVVVSLPEDSGSYTMAFVRAAEIGGDKVSMSYPEEMKITVDPKGEQPSLDMVIRGAITHIISGTKEARDHDFSSENMTLAMSSNKPGLKMDFAFSDLVAKYQNTGDEVRNTKGGFKAARVVMKYDLVDAGNDMKMNAVYNNMSATFDVDAISEDTVSEMLNGARNLSMTYTVASTQSTIDMKSPSGAFAIEGTTGSGTGAFDVQGGLLSMNGVGNDTNYTVQMKDLPFPPFNISVDEATMAMQMPLKKEDAPSDARMQFGFGGLKASDTVWGMFDPTGSLPRDKANLNIDLTAQVKWLVDVMKVEEAENMPAEVSSVTINDISVDIAGASFNGTGAATLDNSRFPPVPAGEVNLDLKGGIGLVDKLVALGMVPQQQGQMVKMMSGMFAVPGGEGDDHLTSKIEMTKNGAIFANGQRIQ